MKKLKVILIFAAAVASATAAPLPFSENFDALSEGSLDGRNGWVVQGGIAAVQTNVVQGGRAVELSVSSISQDLSSTNSLLWMTFWARCEETPEVDPVVTNVNTSVAFYINTNQNLVVTSNTTPVELSVQVATHVWTRFDVYCDYENLTWNLSVNRTNVVAGFPLYSSNEQVGSIMMKNESANAVYLDAIAVTDIEPVADVIDTDGDTIPDWWEQKHFGSITAASPVASASNGVNNLTETYIAGLDPAGEERFEFALDNNPLQLFWSGKSGRIYSVYWTSNLVSGFTLLQAGIPASQTEFTDIIHTNGFTGFYQVRVGL